MRITERRLRRLIREVLEVRLWSANDEVNAVAQQIVNDHPNINLNNLDKTLSGVDLDKMLSGVGLYQTDSSKSLDSIESLRSAIEEVLRWRKELSRS